MCALVIQWKNKINFILLLHWARNDRLVYHRIQEYTKDISIQRLHYIVGWKFMYMLGPLGLNPSSATGYGLTYASHLMWWDICLSLLCALIPDCVQF